MEEITSSYADSSRPGFTVVHSYGAWRMAIINETEKMRKCNITETARHMETDEVFTLLSGSAVMHLGENGDVDVPLEAGVPFVVKRGEWHALETLEGARLLVAENSDTTQENTEKRSITLF